MRALNSSSSAGRHLRLDGFCQRRAASPPSGLPALALPPLRGGPLPLQARVLTAPKQRRRLQTLRPSCPSPCSCPVVDTPAAESRQPLPSGTVFAVFSPAGGFFPPSWTVFTDFGPVDGLSLPRGQFLQFSVLQVAFSRLRAIFRSFQSRGWPFPVVRANFRRFLSRGRTFPAVGDSFRLFQSPSASGSGTFRWKRR